MNRTLLKFGVASAVAGLVCSVANLSGCLTDAQEARRDAWHSPADITCHSGGKVIYQGRSTDKVLSEENSDGYYFVDAADGLLREVSGDCVIVYIQPQTK